MCSPALGKNSTFSWEPQILLGAGLTMSYDISFPSHFWTQGKSSCQILKQSVKFCVV